MSYEIVPIIHMLISVICFAAQITAALYLLPDKGSGPWLVLVGSVVTMIGMVGAWFVPYFSPGPLNLTYINLMAPVVVICGSLISCSGWLMYALHRRGQRNRVAELEAIIETIQKS